MTASHLTLSLLPEHYAICRLAPDALIPKWALRGPFFSITRTSDELSIVCPETNMPRNVSAVRGWRCLKLHGPFDFSQVGILAALVEPLAAAGISIFAISTHDTDYLLVQSENLEKALSTLVAAGHTVREP